MPNREMICLWGIMILWEEKRMNLNLRHAIMNNVSGNTPEQLEDTIVDAIESGEEKMLPGLGVLFEVIWQNSSDQEKNEMLQALESGVKKQ
jgi:small acid-soluble spore protein I (minor)